MSYSIKVLIHQWFLYVNKIENYDKYALGYCLHMSFIALTETLKQELRQADLDFLHPQFTILQSILRNPGMSQSELACATTKNGATIARSVVHLEKRGLLERKWLNDLQKRRFRHYPGEAFVATILMKQSRKRLIASALGLKGRM